MVILSIFKTNPASAMKNFQANDIILMATPYTRQLLYLVETGRYGIYSCLLEHAPFRVCYLEAQDYDICFGDSPKMFKKCEQLQILHFIPSSQTKPRSEFLCVYVTICVQDISHSHIMGKQMKPDQFFF